MSGLKSALKSIFQEMFLFKYPRNRKSTVEHEIFVDESIEDLLKVGAVETVVDKPTVVSPLAVVQGKKIKTHS